ncbi:hypothetical protein Avbf_00038 [Armadillidium vulgare]|nr:hypothetical protein Avbf_00038 [Armadillidium vulgare]
MKQEMEIIWMPPFRN